MSDERLLSEALRAHAAGGVSTPRADAAAPPSGSPATTPGAEGAPASGRRRFRPLGRVRRPEQTQPDQARPEQGRLDQGRPEQARPDQSRADQSRADQSRPDQPRTDQGRLDQARPDVPAPRSGGPGLPPPGYARGPMPPAPPTAPVRPGPAGGYGVPNGPARGYGPAARPGSRPAPASTATPAGYVPWSAVTVTWWSVVAVLAGGVVGGAIGVLSLLLPA